MTTIEKKKAVEDNLKKVLKRFYLLKASEFEDWKKYYQNSKNLNVLDQQMMKVLNDKNLPIHQKYGAYQTLLQKFSGIKKKMLDKSLPEDDLNKFQVPNVKRAQNPKLWHYRYMRSKEQQTDPIIRAEAGAQTEDSVTQPKVYETSDQFEDAESSHHPNLTSMSEGRAPSAAALARKSFLNSTMNKNRRQSLPSHSSFMNHTGQIFDRSAMPSFDVTPLTDFDRSAMPEFDFGILPLPSSTPLNRSLEDAEDVAEGGDGDATPVVTQPDYTQLRNTPLDSNVFAGQSGERPYMVKLNPDKKTYKITVRNKQFNVLSSMIKEVTNAFNSLSQEEILQKGSDIISLIRRNKKPELEKMLKGRVRRPPAKEGSKNSPKPIQAAPQRAIAGPSGTAGTDIPPPSSIQSSVKDFFSIRKDPHSIQTGKGGAKSAYRWRSI